MTLETNNNNAWRGRKSLPVASRLNLKFDIEKLRAAFNRFSEEKQWDSLGSEYIGLCETHTRLPKMFFKEEELEGVTDLCDMNWEGVSYQQLTLTEWDAGYSLNERQEKSHSAWDARIAKGDKKADERWYRKPVSDTPSEFLEALSKIKNFHRARFAKLRAHSEIKPHIDYDTTYGIRIHIPIITNDRCIFGGVDNEGHKQEFHMPADGGAWFINPGLKHWAQKLR